MAHARIGSHTSRRGRHYPALVTGNSTHATGIALPRLITLTINTIAAPRHWRPAPVPCATPHPATTPALAAAAAQNSASRPVRYGLAPICLPYHRITPAVVGAPPRTRAPSAPPSSAPDSFAHNCAPQPSYSSTTPGHPRTTSPERAMVLTVYLLTPRILLGETYPFSAEWSTSFSHSP